jgi:hypothetical protein
MGSTDPDLARLVADMSVTQTPARRNGGGVGNEQGTSDDGLSTVNGLPFTVMLDGSIGEAVRHVPREVHMADGHTDPLASQTANGKRVKIFVVPGWEKGFSTFCFQFIGQGASFCTTQNCTTAHHHASKKEVRPGEIYVAKSHTTAFATPSLEPTVIDEDVLADWKALSLSLSDWNEKFFIATNTSDELPASSAAMEVQEAFFRNKALNYKTPAKRKRSQEEEESESPSLLDVSIYSQFFKEGVETPITELGHVTGILARMDQGINTNNEAVINLIGDYRHEHGKAGEALRVMWLRLEALSHSVGTVPTKLAFDYLAPSAWASIGAIAAKLDEIWKNVTAQGTRLDTYKKEVEKKVDEKVQLGYEDIYKRLDDFKLAFIQALRGLGGRMDNLELRMIGNPNPPPAPFPPPPAYHQLAANDLTVPQNPRETIVIGDDDPNEIVSRVERRVDEMERKLQGLLAKNEDKAIRFAGLGFQSISESNAWLETSLRNHQSGLIVDVHMVFEHVFHAIEGIDTIATMEKLYKIKVLCIADSVAMTSFDAKTPKYFSRLQGHRVLKLDASYFDTITSHADWADVATGFKMRLQEALAEFQESHTCFIDQAVEPGSKAHALAHSALTESVAWIIGFIQFIDEYYRELAKAKFGPTKAWHVTTRLAKRILEEVGTPRYGVQGAFQVGDSTQICQQIFWAVLKSHDVMASYKRLNFKNHPSIATELVKFLAINTSFEAIEKLTTKTTVLDMEVADMKKKVNEAVKAATTAANKADEGKRLLDLLTKRVKTQEERR